MNVMIGSLRRISVALLLVTASSVSAQEAGHTSDPLDLVKARVESGKAILVDVREKKEWDRGHIRKAVLLPLSQLAAWERGGISEAEKAKLAKALPKGTVVYCHCAAGGRSLPGGEALRKLGYDARPLKEGYEALIEAGFPKDSGR
jgi:phage shock protein E